MLEVDGDGDGASDSSEWYELSNERNIFCLSLPTLDLGLCSVQPTQQARLRFAVSELHP